MICNAVGVYAKVGDRVTLTEMFPYIVTIDINTKLSLSNLSSFDISVAHLVTWLYLPPARIGNYIHYKV